MHAATASTCLTTMVLPIAPRARRTTDAWATAPRTCGYRRGSVHGCLTLALTLALALALSRWLEQLRTAGLPQAVPLHEAMGFPGPTQA